MLLKPFARELLGLGDLFRGQPLSKFIASLLCCLVRSSRVPRARLSRPVVRSEMSNNWRATPT